MSTVGTVNRILGGDKFNQIYKDRRFIVITDELDKFGEIKLVDGLNIDKTQFTPYKDAPGGFHFVEQSKVYEWITIDHMYIRDVYIPSNATVYVNGDYFKSNMIVVENKRQISEDEQLCITILKSFVVFDSTGIKSKSEIYMNAIEKDGCSLKYIHDQTENLCKDAVSQNGFALKYVKEQTEELCMYAIKQNPLAIQFMKEQTTELAIYAVFKNAKTIMYIQNQQEEICMIAVTQDPLTIKYIKNQTPSLCEIAVTQNGLVIEHIRNKSIEICRLAVKQNGFALEYIPNQTEEICKMAVSQTGLALKFVNDNLQSQSINLIAIEQNSLAFQFVKNKTEDVCNAALKRDGKLLRFIENQTETMCREAVKQNGLALKYVIIEQSYEVRRLAISQNPAAKKFVKTVSATGRISAMISDLMKGGQNTKK